MFQNIRTKKPNVLKYVRKKFPKCTLTVASPIANFLSRYLELGTGTPYHETESLVNFSRLGKITHKIKNGHFRLTSGQTFDKNSILGNFRASPWGFF